jgi:hypothetical protein
VRLRVVSLRKTAEALETPFTPQPLLVLGEYTLALFRCEGCADPYRNMDYDELLWPQDGAMNVQGEPGELTVEAGELLCIPRGWKHSTAADGVSFVVSVSRTEHAISRNGYHLPKPPDPPRHANPEHLLSEGEGTSPHFLLQCDDLSFYAQRLTGATPSGSSGQGIWVIPLSGTVGVRCGGVVTTLRPTEIVQVPAHCNWHLFGKADVVWATLP